jgi:hypothetical protein
VLDPPELRDALAALGARYTRAATSPPSPVPVVE